MAIFKLNVSSFKVLRDEKVCIDYPDGATIQFEVDSCELLDVIGEEYCAQYFELVRPEEWRYYNV